MAATQTAPTLSIGVLLLDNHELLDSTGPIDLLTNVSHHFLTQLPQTEAFLPLAPRITWHYISHSLSPMSAAGGPHLLPTTTYTTCPPLDVLIIPGTDVLAPLRDDVKDFMVARVDEVQAVLAVCSASLVLAKAGVLAGKRAMSNKMVLKAIGQDDAFGAHWVLKGRWMRDGNIWTCGGVTAGMDMTAAWMLDNFDNALVKWSFEVAEFEPKEGGWSGFDYLTGEV
ncbi:ThiJ/PfpI [Tuber indicum]|nr:ThiJ/PfpI [Tuber indicum]